MKTKKDGTDSVWEAGIGVSGMGDTRSPSTKGRVKTE